MSDSSCIIRLYLVNDSASKRCLKIPCTEADINATTDLQPTVYSSLTAPDNRPFKTKNTGEIQVGESIYYTCADYVKVRDLN